MATEERRRSRRVLIGVAAAAAILLGVGTTGWVITTQADHRTVDMRGHPVTADPGAAPPPEAQKKMDADDAVGQQRFQVPSVNLDVPLGALNAVNGEIQPPGFTSAYWVRNEGTSPAQNAKGTVFIVAHSLRHGGLAPGNYLFDVATGKARVVPGAIILVNGASYTVTGSSTASKGNLPSDAAVWANVPGRLVVITCLQVPRGTPSVDNLIITANLTNGTTAS